MKTIWNSYKRKESSNIVLLIFAFVLNLFFFASQNQIYCQMSCGYFNYECKVKAATKLIKLSPKDPINYYNRAVAYRNLGENELAIEDYSKAIELKSDFYKSYYNRSVIYYEMGKTDEAIEGIIKVLEINPEVAEAYFVYGYIYFRNEKYQKALEKLNKAIELNSKYAKAYQFRAKTFTKLGEKEKSKADLETLAKLQN